MAFCHRDGFVDESLQRPWMSKKYIIKGRRAHFNTIRGCKGCGKEFAANIIKSNNVDIAYSYQYLIHCIEECNEYKNLGLIFECKKCGCKLLDRKHSKKHKC